MSSVLESFSLWKVIIPKRCRKIIFACMFSVHDVISLPCQIQVSLMRLRLEKYFSRHRVHNRINKKLTTYAIFLLKRGPYTRLQNGIRIILHGTDR